MYRVKSNAVWHSLPGIICAYQPIAAPNPLAARQNVAHGGARFGVYTAALGVAPTWAGANGWTFNGSTTYLRTNLYPSYSISVLVRFSNAAALNNGQLFGSYSTPIGNSRYGIIPNSTIPGVAYSYDESVVVTPGLSSGVLGIAGAAGYRNGIFDATLSATETVSSATMDIGRRNNATVPDLYYSGNIQAIVFVSRTLSFAEAWLASRQMAYCEQNPDWNAWARRRRYYYAPQAATTFQPAWARNTNSLLGGGFD